MWRDRKVGHPLGRRPSYSRSPMSPPTAGTTSLSRSSFSSTGSRASLLPNGEYECVICSRRFASATVGLHHYNEHFSLAECTVCGRWVRRGAWKLHRAVFHSAKAHTCVYCGKAFVSCSGRADHVAAKHEGPHYRCTKCHHVYVSIKTFREHRCVRDRQIRRDLQAVRSQPHTAESARPGPSGRCSAQTPRPTVPPPG